MSSLDEAHDVLVTEFYPLAQEAFSKAGHREIWGVEFPDSTDEWTTIHRGVLTKFVTAKPTITEASEQLINTLKWRKEFKPLDAAYNETHSHLYEPLGVITPATEDRPVVTWNLYGAVTDPSTVFADLDAFLRWRVGLMERGIAQLDFSDPERSTMDQVHDYMNVSFLRMNPQARKGSQAVVQVFQDYYPELLRAKYFVNIPLLMMWVFKFVRMRMDTKTADKFHVVHNGPDLASHLGIWVPKAYGGSGRSLQEQSISSEEIKAQATAQGKETTEDSSKQQKVTEPTATTAVAGAHQGTSSDNVTPVHKVPGSTEGEVSQSAEPEVLLTTNDAAALESSAPATETAPTDAISNPLDPSDKRAEANA